MHIEPPSLPPTGLQYDRECRAALRPGFGVAGGSRHGWMGSRKGTLRAAIPGVGHGRETGRKSGTQRCLINRRRSCSSDVMNTCQRGHKRTMARTLVFGARHCWFASRLQNPPRRDNVPARDLAQAKLGDKIEGARVVTFNSFSIIALETSGRDKANSMSCGSFE